MSSSIPLSDRKLHAGMNDKNTQQTSSQQRLLSLDALRGLDMMCIIGLDAIVHALAPVLHGASAMTTLATQFRHCHWEGIHAYDLIFPLFLFISGISMAFSIRKMHQNGASRKKASWHLIKRALILACLGIVVNGPLELPCSDWRFASVLGLIGIAGACAGLLALWVKKIPWLAGILAGILVLIGCLQLNIGTLDREGSINAIIDRAILPGSLHGGVMDPEGILCIVSAIAVALGGYLVGNFLVNSSAKPGKKAWSLLGAGAVCLIAGYAMHWSFYPAIKSIWSSSFDLIASGWSLLAFATAYFLFDILKWHKLAYPFKVVGMNALFIYLAQSLVNFNSIANHLFIGIADIWPAMKWPILSLATFLIKWLILAWMDKRKIYIKI